MQSLTTKILVGVSYVAMVVVNYLATALPLNNRSTGEISNAYPNLFAPAGVTFSIWGLIYSLLGGYVLLQFIKKNKNIDELCRVINPLFIGTCIVNSFWIFSWHYDFIGVSVLLMLTLLLLLVRINDNLRVVQFGAWERLFIWAPFSVYFGWITVATIANVTVFLVSIGWNGLGIADFVWTSVILIVGALIGVLRMSKDKNVLYGLVLVWAYLGILLKHVSAGGFGGQYPSIIVTLTLCLVFFGFIVGRMFFFKKSG